MKNNKPTSSAQPEQAMQQILQAERNAERSIKDCEDEAQQTIRDAKIRAQRIEAHADQRITNMEMRHSHKINRLTRDIERQGAAELRNDAGQQFDRESLQAVVEKLAAELCLSGSASDDEPDPGK